VGRRHRARTPRRHAHRQVRHLGRHPAADRLGGPLEQRTKATPSLSGDILGDWREEVVWPTGDNTALRIYSTPYETGTRITTLLHDTQYRTALAWQNTAYNQPPHPSFFIGDGMATPPRPAVHTP
jgi:rhamnogalacturonan endolyase